MEYRVGQGDSASSLPDTEVMVRKAKSKASLGRNGKRMTSPWELMMKC